MTEKKANLNEWFKKKPSSPNKPSILQVFKKKLTPTQSLNQQPKPQTSNPTTNEQNPNQSSAQSQNQRQNSHKQTQNHQKPSSRPFNQNPPHKKPHRPFPAKKTAPQTSPPKTIYHKKVRFIPLGGLNEVGKNMMAIEYGNDIIILDMGLEFPSDDMLGIDYIVPDITYLKNNLSKIRGVLITHGHLDHIGGISFIAPQLNNPPFFSLRLTNGFIETQISEHSSCRNLKLVTVQPKQKFKLGVFTIQFFRVNHSIPDSTGIIIETPEGIVVHTGDFKFDFTPADNLQADIETMKWLGTQNVLALFSDSTNSTKPGHTVSEKYVGEILNKLIEETEGRIILASFSSLIGRMQQIFDSAIKHKRKIFISGRSMINNVAVATKLGYLKYPKDLIKPLNRNKNEATKSNSLILTTGSQGEPMSALTRMANNEHAHVKINSKDTIIFSSNPIVGNERGITAVVNELSKKGANVITNQAMDVHTTGHGNQEDLKLMFEMIKPKYLIPVHGEYYMRKAHKDLALANGFTDEKVILLENGSVLEAENKTLTISKETVPSNYIMVDNQTGTLSDVAHNIISERQSMSKNGIICILLKYNPSTNRLVYIHVKSYGFIYMKQTAKILKTIEGVLVKKFQTIIDNKSIEKDKEKIKIELRSLVLKLITEKIERRPLIFIDIV